MQAGTTRLPEVTLCRRFKRFMREELDVFAGDGPRLLAHPGAATPLPARLTAGARPLLAIGPEGGWTDLELEAFQTCGFERFSLGTRTLRTDTACIALLAVLGHAAFR
jgi:RsmE family RNA methyltransferase